MINVRKGGLLCSVVIDVGNHVHLRRLDAFTLHVELEKLVDDQILQSGDVVFVGQRVQLC